LDTFKREKNIFNQNYAEILEATMSEVTSQRGAFCQYGSLLVPNYLFSKAVVERSCDENLV